MRIFFLPDLSAARLHREVKEVFDLIYDFTRVKL